MVESKEPSKRPPWIRFEHPEPNDLWQMDFKGPFETDVCRCHPLTILDDHSRYNLCLQACSNQRKETVQQHLITVFRMNGMPWEINTDNGPPWGTEQGEFTYLAMWLIRLGVNVSHSRPFHPQTNGKDERFHRTLKAEVIQGKRFKSIAHVQDAFDYWRPMYNCERPHEGINDQVPMDRYHQSCRAYPEKPPAIEYAPGDIVKKVTMGGGICYNKRFIRVPKFLKGEYVAIRMTIEDGVIDLFYAQQKLKRINLRTGEACD